MLTCLQQLQFQTLGAPFESRPQVIKIYHVVYIRYGNIRDAVLTLMDKTVKPDGWQIEAVSAKEINEVSFFPFDLLQTHC